MKRLLLIGAGHAHAVVLRALAKEPLLGARIDFVSARGSELYSGMVPGVIAGHYQRTDAEVDFRALAERAYVEFLETSVTGLDLARRTALLADGRTLGYDIASLNVGSRVDTSVRGAELALAVKPFDKLLGALGTPRRIAIAGAGAAGAELAMALRFRGAEAVALYSDAAAPSMPHAARIERILRRAKVDFRPGMPLEAIEPGPTVLSGATRQDFDLVILASGPRALDWPRASGLAAHESGYVRVTRTLQSVSHPEIFAAGDCAVMEGMPEPKSGVFAVRQGEVLHRNLVAAAADQALAGYVPRRRALSILSCGARYAVATWGEWAAEGRWVWHWKDRIDRRWVASLRSTA
ncbi:MAG TPA: FAD-dependent oxidoreductase [Burkholderiales bacterium]